MREERMIYIVDDDDGIRGMLEYALTQAGFAARGFANGEDFMRALAAGAAPGMVLLDIMLPGRSGLELLAQLRGATATANLPVIMLTARGSELDRISGLDAGADDYIAKPFSVMEAISRIKAVLRRTAPAAPAGELAVGEIVLDADKREVHAAGAAVTLTYKEFELLRYLMANAGRVLDRDRILGEIWGYDYASGNRTVDMHIKTLRQKLGAPGAAIKTIRNVGYKIEAT
jgi:two-component system alkaline phosphatase synthesis response regulator PhoP